MFILIISIISIIAVLLFLKWIHTPTIEPYLSPMVGPVDMLQMKKQLLMDGYRFQNSLFPSIEGSQRCVTDCQPIDRQRVGIFKNSAYIDSLNEADASQSPIIEGYTSPTSGTVAQLNAKGDQDKYIYGTNGEPIEDSERPLSYWVHFGRPERMREINYPNEVFSWGDVIHRYKGEITIV